MSRVRMDAEYMLMNRPIPVRWGAFESTTHHMQSTGWKMSVSMDERRFGYHIGFVNEQWRIEGFSERMEIMRQRDGQHQEMSPIVIQHMAPKINVYNVQADMNVKDFSAPVDFSMRAMRCEHPMQRYFNFALENSKQCAPTVKLDEANLDVIDHLQRILDSQQEEAAERRSRDLTEQSTDQLKFHIVA